MIQKIKENKLRSICIGVSAFLFGFITVSLFNNINNTYAIDTSPICPVGWYLDTWTSSDTACCPQSPEYKYNGKEWGAKCALAGAVGDNYETCPYGNRGENGTCWIASVQPEAPSCYACGNSQGASYVWGNYSKSSSCTKKDLSYENCKNPTYSCYYCPTTKNYSWGTTKPTSSCETTGWQVRSDITSSSACSASCYYCPTSNSYSWSTTKPTSSCETTGWQLRSDIITASNCTTSANPNKYVATFYPNGGTFSTGKETYTKIVYEGINNYFSNIGIPTITKSGCTLDGWHEGTATGSVYRQYFSINKDTNFYANWNCSSSGGSGTGETSPTTYIIKYDANGGTGAPANQTKTEGTALTLSSTKPTKEGYTFVSWNTKKDGTGTKYDAGASYTTDSELTLYAQYKETAVTYTVKYDANGGSGEPANQTKNKGTALTLSDTKPTKEGYTFVSWNTKKDGTGSSYAAGGKYNSDANVTLYAQYEKKLNGDEDVYTITFYMNDGTTEKNTKKVNKGEKIVKIADPTREGYTFDGWYDKKENGKEYDFSKEVNSDINLYAYWSKIGDKTKEEITENSKTGDTLIFIAWVVGIGALTYSVYYFKSKKETI